MKRRIWIAWITLACAAAACGDANVAGNYTAAITNGADGCSIGWDVGEQANATFTVNQSGSDVTLLVTGGAVFFFSVLLGADTFTGSVDGDDVDASLIGTRSQTSGGCVFTLNAKISATQDGDAMNGRVEYRTATNGHADCGSRETCVSRQDFNATRPPPAAE